MTDIACCSFLRPVGSVILAAKVSHLILTRRGIVSGYPDGTYRPDAAISQEAFIKLAVAALGLPRVESIPAPSFTDVRTDRWSAPYVEAAVRVGLLAPVEHPDRRLHPERDITRLEMAVILVRALGLWKEAEFDTHVTPFSDADSTPRHRRGYVAIAASKGLMAGMPDGRFAGSEPATRAQAAVVIARLLEARTRWRCGTRAEWYNARPR